MMKKRTIAALLTCYNRKQKTLDCLNALFNQSVLQEVALSVYLVDDGGTDGTAEAIGQVYPQVILLKGDGNLFWNGGMRKAFAAALEQDYDYYLWLNDDTLLYAQALQVLLETSDELLTQGQLGAIVAGSTCDPVSGALTYGGVVRDGWWRPLRFANLEPGQQPQRCATINGNFVLIPRSVAQTVGNLDPAFTHYIGDWDYGLRAQKHGCSVWLAPGYIGTCPQNLRPRNWAETISDLPWHQQLKRVGQPKGLILKNVTLQPLNEWRVFAQRYAGFLWLFFWLFPYTRLFWLPILDRIQRVRGKISPTGVT